MTTSYCPSPFLSASQFTHHSSSYIQGRLCFSLKDGEANSTCCLPCPAIDWIYPSSFRKLCRAASILHIPGLVLCLILLVALAKDRRAERLSRQLSIGLVIGICSLALGFIIPLAARPNQCADAITPRDMHTSGVCIYSGALIVLGALSATVWIFIKTVTLHMHICWSLKPSRKYDVAVQIIGWTISAVFFSLTLSLSGVSFRFGDTCHVNIENSIPTFWGPLLTLAGLSSFLQLSTFIYCINTYINRRSLFSEDLSKISQQSRIREVQQVVKVQWRSIFIVFLIVFDVTFFAILFVYLDQRESQLLSEPAKVIPWVECILENPNSMDNCLYEAERLFIPESAIIMALFLLAATGYQCFILVFPLSVRDRWVEAIKKTGSKWNTLAYTYSIERDVNGGEIKH